MKPLESLSLNGKILPAETLITVFSRHLKELRDERHLNQYQVAEKLGVAPSTYANWEQGRRMPGIPDIYNLIYVFNIDANELLNINTKYSE